MTSMPRRNDSRNDTAACPACGQAFTPAGRRRWCSDACRQAAWRRRHPAAPAAGPLPAAQPARDHTIYQCPGCDQRYLGQQRCDDCGTFCRRIGPGGPCPHCDEPVAISDLTTISQPSQEGQFSDAGSGSIFECR
jgi:predicted amidophosphoribosyltransferase